MPSILGLKINNWGGGGGGMLKIKYAARKGKRKLTKAMYIN